MVRGLGAMVALVTVVALGAPAHATVTADGSLAANGRIAYRDGSSIYVASSDGTRYDLLVTDAEFGPAWSPDGKWFLWASQDGRLIKSPPNRWFDYVLTERALGFSQFAWTRDGAHVIYSASGLYYVSADGSGAGRRLFDETQRTDNWPTTAPNGMVVFHRLSPGGTRLQLFAYTPGSAGPTLLIDYAQQPDFSPDGARLAYVVPDSRTGTSQVWIANADGSNPVQITRESQFGATTPRWSPDGASILYIHRTGLSGHQTLKKRDLASGRVTWVAGHADDMSWQPAPSPSRTETP